MVPAEPKAILGNFLLKRADKARILVSSQRILDGHIDSYSDLLKIKCLSLIWSFVYPTVELFIVLWRVTEFKGFQSHKAGVKHSSPAWHIYTDCKDIREQ